MAYTYKPLNGGAMIINPDGTNYYWEVSEARAVNKVAVLNGGKVDDRIVFDFSKSDPEQ